MDTIRFRLVFAMLGVLLMLLLGACSDDAKDSSSTELASATTAAGATIVASASSAGGARAAETPQAAATTNDAASSVDTATVDAGRKLIRTASMDVQVDDVVVASNRAIAVVEGTGGALAKQAVDLGGNPTATLVLKVLPERMQSTIAELTKIGTVTKQNVGSDDVTAKVVDLDARIQAMEVSVVRVREFLAGATSPQVLTQFEAELNRREADLESLRGQMRTINSQVDQATITLNLSKKAVPVDKPAVVEPASHALPGVGDALGKGWRAFASAAQVVAIVLAASLPFLVVAGFLVLVALMVRRSRRRAPIAEKAPVEEPVSVDA
ncbi:MAG: DUF4349 domain-containing protein [Acidimicrobiia bacterium]